MQQFLSHPFASITIGDPLPSLACHCLYRAPISGTAPLLAARALHCRGLEIAGKEPHQFLYTNSKGSLGHKCQDHQRYSHGVARPRCSQRHGNHKHAADMRQTCGRHAADMRQTCDRHAANMRQTCGRRAADMRQTCGRHAASSVVFRRLSSVVVWCCFLFRSFSSRITLFNLSFN